MTGGALLGYRSAAYAAALPGFGSPLPWPEAGTHLLCRRIAGSARTDLAGVYPLFAAADWSAVVPALHSAWPGDPVTLTLVTDAFCPLPEAALSAAFDRCSKLHDHHVIDLGQPLAPSRHHRRKLRQARDVRIEAGPADRGLAAAWVALYAQLAARKDITDLRAFTPDSLAQQLAVPGAHLVTAWAADRLIGADLYYCDGPVAHAHLSAYAPEGYAQSVSYPMIVAAAEYFAGAVRWIDLGGAPADGGGGIAAFKRGWGGATRPSYLCGKVFDPAAYRALSGETDTAYFPAYRAGEFSNSRKPRDG